MKLIYTQNGNYLLPNLTIKNQNTKGINKYGLNTIGKPKISGSFILKRPGTKAILNKDFNCWDFTVNIPANKSPRVRPQPPLFTNTSLIWQVIIFA